jgi:hypothetical protein
LTFEDDGKDDIDFTNNFDDELDDVAEGNTIISLEPTLLSALVCEFNFDFAAAMQDDNDDNRAESNDVDDTEDLGSLAGCGFTDPNVFIPSCLLSFLLIISRGTVSFLCAPAFAKTGLLIICLLSLVTEEFINSRLCNFLKDKSFFL